MKRHIQTLGVRKWSGNDLLELQSEGLSVLDNFFAQYGNCIIDGCEVAENAISKGLVSIDGMVLPFDGATDIHTFPVYLKKSETYEQREYADGIVRDIAVQYYAEMVLVEPSDSHIRIATEENITFFDKVNPSWLDGINSSIDVLRAKDIIIMNILQQLDISTLLAKPTSETLTYTKDGKIYNFWVGQQCRVYDSETQKYTFYQLYNIVDGVADWQTLGKGDDSGMYEAPTLNDIPDEDTLNYTKNRVICNFLIGQQCRVYDERNKKYVFYQLYDINAQSKANWQIAGTDGSAFEETITIILESNQGAGDTSLLGKVVTVSWLGQERPIELIWNGDMLSATIPISIQYEVSVESINGYTSPETQSYLAIGGNKRQLNFVYLCEKIVTTVIANDGTETNTRTVTVKHTITGATLGRDTGSTVIIKVPMDTPYKISVDDWTQFVKPSEQSFTANLAQRNVSFEYKRMVDASIIFDKSISDPSNISGEINDGTLAIILSKFRRCLCKKTASGEVTIAYLKDSDSTKYEDGTTAVLTGVQGDVMVDFPEFYYKREDVDANKFRYRFAEYNIDGTFKHVPRSLVGAYKSYLTSNKLYSRSGVTPTADKTFPSFSAAAQARGTGYQLIDFQQHCVIAFMLYAKYGNRNLQAILGAGGANYQPATITGTTNSIGITDTVNENTNNKYVNGLGLEGVFGGLYEFVQGVSINNYVWTITDPNGAVRNITAHNTAGWIIAVAAESGAYFDMVPTKVGGSETTYYSDQYYLSSGVAYRLLRSNYYSDTTSGVAFMNAGYNDSFAYGYVGSRLAFRGTITKASSVSSFEALPIM